MKEHITLSSRRDFIKIGALSAAALALNRLFAPRLSAEEASVSAQKKQSKAKAVIAIFLAGGPCHIDTFDPKPEATRDIIGPYTKVCPTNIEGIAISQMLPLTAKHADKYSIIRGMTHKDNSHEISTYMMLSGVPAGGELVYPSMGSVIASKVAKKDGADLPAYISIMDPYSRFDESGFIGESGRSFAASGIISRGDLELENKKKPRPSKIKSDADKISSRRDLLSALDALRDCPSEEMQNADAQRQTAYSMLIGNGKKAFDLSLEPQKAREAYGTAKSGQEKYFGQQLLLARRLVEAGATYVNVMLHGWDTHKKHFEAMATMLPALDKAYAALISDLHERGLLDTTIVTLGGEFGRTPKIMYNTPWMGGRNHFGAAFSWVVAGGGFVGGNVVGKTDATGSQVVERPVYPWDLSESIYALTGVDTNDTLPHPTGCVAHVVPPEVGKKPSGGMLSEIMKI
ncbi:MAG: DUF1501 domain-containing protein [Opitutales bacterium]|nr:DUF1501 domain-containing protein [Opitutales bacterium]